MKTRSARETTERLFVSSESETEFNQGVNEDFDFHSNNANAGIANELLRTSSDLEQNFHPPIINQNHSNFSEEAWTCLFNNRKSSTSLSSNSYNEGLSYSTLSEQTFPSLFPEYSDEREDLESQTFCNVSWDGMLCWPETPVGNIATLSCFSHLNGVGYDTSRKATRFCQEDGYWQNRTDYTNCQPLPNLPGAEDNNLIITTSVYLAGYSLSLCLLAIAMIIFISFKELRCLRNKIHSHLIITYILSDTLWIVTSIMSSQTHMRGPSHHVSCITFILLHYFHMTNFFWMFVEGLYLYVLVVQTFVAENIKLRVYAAIGWGIPLMVVLGWSLAKWMTQSTPVDTNTTDPEFGNTSPACLWLHVNVYDWIYKGPAIFALVLNTVFISKIMWVLITKLRSAMNPETQQSRKAAKALLVLIPLLGITYLLILAGSKHIPAYEHLRALLISTQGFLVALLYCFLNGEVQVALRHQWNRIREIGPNFSCCGCEFVSERQHMQQMHEWSPKSRTESIRLYTPTGQSCRKRDSSASDGTTMTIFHQGGSLNGNRRNTLVPVITVVNKNNRFTTSIGENLQTCKISKVNVNDSTTIV